MWARGLRATDAVVGDSRTSCMEWRNGYTPAQLEKSKICHVLMARLVEGVEGFVLVSCIMTHDGIMRCSCVVGL